MGNPFKAGATFIGDTITGGGFQAQKQFKKGEAALQKERARAKIAMLESVDRMRAPTMSTQMANRLRALETESQGGPLSQNAYFQGNRANLVQGARQEAAGIQNAQRAHGIGGGFSNVGSTQDAYDRLSGQLAALGQSATQRMDEQRDYVAESYQDQVDKEAAFINAQEQARRAIEAGDLELAVEIITGNMHNRANSSRKSYQYANNLAGQIVGAAMGNPGAMGGGAKSGGGGGAAGGMGGF